MSHLIALVTLIIGVGADLLRETPA